MTIVHGGDVSVWNEDIDWDAWRAGGMSFAFIRVCQNLTMDKRFASNWELSRGKTARGGYQFFDWRPGASSPEQQGRFLREALAGEGELPPVMDFEDPFDTFSSSPLPGRDGRFDMMRRWRDGVQVEKPILYCNSAFVYGLRPLPEELMTDWYLWVAQWPYQTGTTSLMTDPSQIGTKAPVTYGWKHTFWQYTAYLPGAKYGVESTMLDGNLFNGTPEEFKALAGGFHATKLTLEEKVSILWNGRCNYCGVLYADEAVTCPKCGAPR